MRSDALPAECEGQLFSPAKTWLTGLESLYRTRSVDVEADGPVIFSVADLHRIEHPVAEILVSTSGHQTGYSRASTPRRLGECRARCIAIEDRGSGFQWAMSCHSICVAQHKLEAT